MGGRAQVRGSILAHPLQALNKRTRNNVIVEAFTLRAPDGVARLGVAELARGGVEDMLMACTKRQPDILTLKEQVTTVLSTALCAAFDSMALCQAEVGKGAVRRPPSSRLLHGFALQPLGVPITV